MKKIFGIVVLSLFMNTSLTAKEVGLLISCKNFKENESVYFKITGNMFIAELLLEYKTWLPVPKENITNSKNYLYWHSGFVEWELNKNTNLLTKKTTFADVVKSRTFTCEYGTAEEKKIDELIKK
tara:strand:- start:508 stop:882 length:375 start_codon:yes stop_codon:yes gene_type:complete